MNKRVLLIEDNAQNRYMATFLLEKHGYEVLSAQDGLSGIALAEHCHPGLILLDIQLPTMHGYDVAVALRKLDILKAVPIIAVTSYAMVGDEEKALKAGCNGYIEKPINPDTFIDEMESFRPRPD
ncbi:MAG: response regulator [Verrucomicrobiales bacterium]